MALIESSSVTAARPAPRGSAPHGDAYRSVVWLRGEYDLSTLTAVSETLARAIAVDEADVVVDLSEVTFMGAETVGMIVRARAFLGLRSRSLELRCPSARARRVLDLCDIALPTEHHRIGIVAATGPAAALGTWVTVPARRPDAQGWSGSPRRAP